MDYGAIIQLIVGMVGKLSGEGKEAEAEALLRQMRHEFGNIPLPTLEEIKAEQLGPSALEGIEADPRLEAAQYESLGQIGDLADDGMGPQDRAALNTLANMSARRQRAGMANIENEMAARGVAGSGMDVAARMANAQDTNQRISEGEQNIAGDAAQRRMQAILAKGDLSGRMRGQQYSEKANAAAARDAIMRFNAASRDSANRYNQMQRQQRFQNQMQRTGAKANPTNALSGFKLQQAQGERDFYGNLGAAAGTTVNSAANNWGNSSGGSLSGYGTNDISDDEENKRRGRKLYEEDEK